MSDDEILLKSNKAKNDALAGYDKYEYDFCWSTSAYVVSSSRADWIQQIDLPFDFTISSLIIILSSVTFYLAFKMLKMKNLKITHSLLVITLLLALAFIYFQVQGFNGIIEKGYYFTGPESSITTSYLYILVLLHIAHLVAGIIIVLYVLLNSFKGLYFKGNTLGFELGSTFWHFLDIL